MQIRCNLKLARIIVERVDYIYVYALSDTKYI